MPTPNPRDANALAAASKRTKPTTEAPAPVAPPAPTIAKSQREKLCVWSDMSQFNLASWVAGKLQATLVVYDIPGVGKCEVTLREVSSLNNRDMDVIVAKAMIDKSLATQGDYQRLRNVLILAASLVAIDGEQWPPVQKDRTSPMTLEDRAELIRGDLTQTMMDLYLKAVSDFQSEVIELMGSVDPKLFASPSGPSAPISPSQE